MLLLHAIFEFLISIFHIVYIHKCTPGPWLLRISVVGFKLCALSKNSPNLWLMRFSLCKSRNSFTLVTNDLSAADLVDADFCQT